MTPAAYVHVFFTLEHKNYTVLGSYLYGKGSRKSLEEAFCHRRSHPSPDSIVIRGCLRQPLYCFHFALVVWLHVTEI